MEVDVNPLIKESRNISCRYSSPVTARKLQSLLRLCKVCRNSLKFCPVFCCAVARICLANIMLGAFTYMFFSWSIASSYVSQSSMKSKTLKSTRLMSILNLFAAGPSPRISARVSK